MDLDFSGQVGQSKEWKFELQRICPFFSELYLLHGQEKGLQSIYHSSRFSSPMSRSSSSPSIPSSPAASQMYSPSQPTTSTAELGCVDIDSFSVLAPSPSSPQPGDRVQTLNAERSKNAELENDLCTNSQTLKQVCDAAQSMAPRLHGVLNPFADFVKHEGICATPELECTSIPSSPSIRAVKFTEPHELTEFPGRVLEDVIHIAYNCS